MDSVAVCKEWMDLPNAFKHRLGCLNSRLVQLVIPEVMLIASEYMAHKIKYVNLGNFQHVNTAQQQDNAYCM